MPAVFLVMLCPGLMLPHIMHGVLDLYRSGNYMEVCPRYQGTVVGLKAAAGL